MCNSASVCIKRERGRERDRENKVIENKEGKRRADQAEYETQAKWKEGKSAIDRACDSASR